MKKRFLKVSNLLLGSVVAALGFGACRSAEGPVGNPTDDADTVAAPAAKQGAKDGIRLVYGPPPMTRNDVRIVYGPPPMKRDDGNEKEELDPTRVYEIVEQMPCFPGGDEAMMTWVRQHLQYPESARRDSIEGRVILTFVVERDGTTTDFKVVRSVHPALDAEALRLLSTMPRWIPGRQNGVALRVKYTYPVTFRLE